MIETYLLKRKGLAGVVLIMDIRRIPDERELNLMAWFKHHHIQRILILTKADKLSRSKQIRQRLAISKTLFMEKNELVLFSAKSGQGKDQAWKAVEKSLSV